MDMLWVNMGFAALVVYLTALVGITIFCLMQFDLLFRYRRYHRHDRVTITPPEIQTHPRVTIQLPIYNERYVVERLIHHICTINYPKDKLQIQILDDSTDDTLQISRRLAAEYAQQGFDISVLHRTNRAGYKAGALQAGMSTAKGCFIAIFDADFLPDTDFLLCTMPYFEQENIGVVQTRWEHLNENDSLITKLQAFQLNVHFRVEQTGRYASNLLLQFNGTAGVWRRKTIEDAGGWHADTLTEDLDLSYRAQLRGWKIRYLENVGSPAELPVQMNALKSQQFRWMKGGAETAKKMLPSIWKANLPFRLKLHATGHLLSSSVFLLVFIAGIFSVPALFTLEMLTVNGSYFTVFFIGLLSIVAVYYTSNSADSRDNQPLLRRILKFIFIFPLFLSLSMGLSLHNSIAVIQGFIGKRSAFIRTPKFNVDSIKTAVKENKYLSRKIPGSTLVEGFLAIYFFIAVVYGLVSDQTTFLVYHILLMVGFGTICFYSIKHALLHE